MTPLSTPVEVEGGGVTHRVVMYSGGIGSYLAARRTVEAHGAANVTLLFADTRMEDADLYRFLDDGAARLGASMVKIADGRTPWEVFKDERFLGNSRVDPCSKILKRELCDRWMREHFTPETAVRVVGIGWEEEHRLWPIVKRLAPWTVEAPMCREPFLSRNGSLAAVRADGIEPPRLYALGFAHNNCGGFCVKAGQAAFARLLETMPERYAEHEEKEREFRAFIGKNVAIMRDRSGGGSRPLTMSEFRVRVQSGKPIDTLDWGACSCFAGASA